LVGASILASFRLPLIAVDIRDDTVPVPQPVRFESRNPAIATVDSAGLIVARAMGSTWIVARAGMRRRLTDSIEVSATCTAELRWRVTPDTVRLAVGATVTPTHELSTCGGYVKLQDQLTWKAIDSSIVRTDASTGRTVALAPGSTAVTVTGQRYGPIGFMAVTVVAR
jgi:hypothetical protein